MENRNEPEGKITHEIIFQIDEVDSNTKKEEERQHLYAQVTEEKLTKIPRFTGRRESDINIFETLANVTVLARNRNLDRLSILRRVTLNKPNRDLQWPTSFQEGAENLLQRYGNIVEIFEALKFKHYTLSSDKLKEEFTGDYSPGYKKQFNHHLKVFNKGVWLTSNIPHIINSVCCQYYFRIALKTFFGRRELLTTRWELLERKERVKKIIDQIQKQARKVNKIDQERDNGKLLQGSSETSPN